VSEDSENGQRLERLLRVSDEQNRLNQAVKLKRDGNKLVGTMSPYVPEEIAIAAGMLPWGVTGTYRAGLPLAWGHRPSYLNAYYSHVRAT
jgi:benzoyl-CoA reductase/2-hydroxyglutaryl-CoA dehydratase subunit BcrC/BadD/HgdB